MSGSYDKARVREKGVDLAYLTTVARNLRRTTLEMIYSAGSGHPGGSLSEIEILTVLYYCSLRISPQNPNWQDRDRFVLSKGHCCPPLYAILADLGFFGRDELSSLRKFGSLLQGHPGASTPGIDMPSGSLGNGLSVGVGMSMWAKRSKRDYRTFVLLGDGELQEGAVWEAALCAAQHKLDNLIAIVDYNGMQINGRVDDIISIKPLVEKWHAFGWQAVEVNGHDIRELQSSLTEASSASDPVAIVAHTVKGKGVSFMENNSIWHGKAPSSEELAQALAELQGDVFYG
jgi:transketolase